jgi:hypothetical protein
LVSFTAYTSVAAAAFDDWTPDPLRAWQPLDERGLDATDTGG